MSAKKIRRAYLIDDDTINNFLCKKILEKSGLIEEVVLFEEATKALANITQALQTSDMLPSLILLDINMPVMNGWEFMEAYQKLGKPVADIRLFILSSSSNEQDMEKAKKYPLILDYLTKPIGVKHIQQLAERFF
ncbi:response regulator [Eisenibacter elegans]|jgi:CheY-like chemotaxis protein|uniref:response regulator n=1 Tax=Eisenibacter elegans TaxID=997 RepID=UPI000417B89A|nr:response regulator [Eisenibacter elegans]